MQANGVGGCEDRMLHLISWSNARLRGVKRYLTGKPCKRGHVVERRTSTGTCLACGPGYSAAYRLVDPEKFRSRYREWRANNADKAREATRIWVASNPGKARSSVDAYQAANPEKVRASAAASRSRNLDKRHKANAAWYRANPHKGCAYANARRARKLRAIPSWFGEFDEFVVEEAAHLCALRRDSFGFKWQMDHMIPLMGENACGLHCANNIQVIPARLNASKKNNLVFTEPLEWLSSVSRGSELLGAIVYLASAVIALEEKA